MWQQTTLHAITVPVHASVPAPEICTVACMYGLCHSLQRNLNFLRTCIMSAPHVPFTVPAPMEAFIICLTNEENNELITE